MNGATTLVAMIEVPSGSLSIRGCATKVYRSFAKNPSGANTMSTATTHLRSRWRSSRRWETSVPSASCSGSAGSRLILRFRSRCLLTPFGRGGLAVRSRTRRLVPQRVVADLLLELRPQLTRHCTCASGPSTEVGRQLRKALGPQDEQRNPEDQDDLGEADFEHRTTSDAGLGFRA